MPKCTKCKFEKEISEFKKDKSKKLGRSSQCKECNNKYLAKYRSKPKNKEKAKAYLKEWNKNNPDKYREYNKKSYNKNKQSHSKRMKKWNENNPNYMKEWSRKNKEKINEKRREKWSNDLTHRLKSNIRTRIYQSIKCKTENSFDALGCKISEYFVYLEKQFDENMNWGNYGTYWEIDHTIPLSKGGSFHYTNTTPMTISENRKKKDKIL